MGEILVEEIIVGE
jgi:hypothetical protein